MRLWHYKLIPVLPNKMLISQWRECIAIKRQWKKGTLKNRLVNYIADYGTVYFHNYVVLIINELTNRGIKFQLKYIDEINDFCGIEYLNIYGDLFYPEHNNRYLTQCFYNLQEKYDRGIITQEEFLKIGKLYWEIDDEKYY